MKIILPTLTFSMLISAHMAFTQPTLVKDNLYVNSRPNAASNSSNFTNLGNKTYFFANGSTYDMGLYVTDGTESGTKLVKQINASVNNVVANDKLIFFVYENSSLFISDGTFEGTKPLAKFRSLNKIINCNGTIYFTADDQIHGLELWKTDGTTAGTKLVKDIAYGLPSSQIVSWKPLGDKLILFADDGINGIEPWVSDGTETGTKMIKNINQASGIEEYASEITLYQVNNYIIFAADNGINGVEFWSTDGTTAGTYMLKDINESGNSVQFFNASMVHTNYKGYAYFISNEGNNNTALYKTDGTPQNTSKIIDVPNARWTGSGFILGNKLIMAIDYLIDGMNSYQLWVTEGTTGTTEKLDLPNFKLGNGSGNFGKVYNDKFYFACYSNNQPAVASTDGTEAGTQLVIESTGGQYATNFLTLENALYFMWGYNSQTQIWRINGINTVAIPGSEFNSISGIMHYNHDSTKIYFPLGHNDYGNEPYVLENDQLKFLKDINTTQGKITKFLYHDNYWYFSSNYQTSPDLWRTDGTIAGTSVVKTCAAQVYNPFVANNRIIFSEKNKYLWSYDGSTSSQIYAFSGHGGDGYTSNPFTVNNKTYYWLRDTGVVALWKTDGTSAGNKLTKKFFTNRNNWLGSVGKPFIFDNKAYFCVSNGDWSDARIYSMDGTSEDTTMLIKLFINNGTIFYDPEFTEINGKIYFRDNSSLYKIENDVVTPIYSSQNTLNQLEALGNKILFIGSNMNNGSEIWISDGTYAGTKILKDIYQGKNNGINFNYWQMHPKLTTFKNNVYFWANDGEHGTELWKSDGTLDGTIMVKDINPGLVSSNPKHFYIQKNLLFFIATDELHGTEIWCTDGTEEGTFIAGEVNSGTLSSLKDPEVFEFASEFESQILFFGKDNDLLFPATNPTNGQQIWKLSISDLKNNAPQISGGINDTSLVIGTPLQYKIPVFSFDDPNDYLSYVATLEDGSPLPEWLKFNESTRTFTGVPPTIETVKVKITAFDCGNLNVSNQFTISVISKPSEVEQMENKAFKVYPNPAKDYLFVELKDEMNYHPFITVSDMQGKELVKHHSSGNISKIDIKSLISGMYTIKVGTDIKSQSLIILVNK